MNPRLPARRGRWLLPALFLLGTAAAAVATHRPASVPPTLEIEVLDPNADPRGNPAVLTRPGILPGQEQIDIPPVVLVHRYYYTGNRTFQARFLPGGPSIVVVNHPKTAERLYIPVQMLPGAPRVTYTHHSIEYDYGNQGITIHFCWLTGKPKVDYRNHVPVGRKVANGAAKVGKAAKNLVDRTGAPEACKSLARGTKNVVVTTADQIGAFGKMVATPFRQVAEMIPGINFLRSSPEDRATALRDARVRQAQFEAEGKDLFIRTNR
jgi:hypothetical protein